MVEGEVDQAKKSFMGMPVSSFDHSHLPAQNVLRRLNLRAKLESFNYLALSSARISLQLY
jgi:hypothetical protein